MDPVLPPAKLKVTLLDRERSRGARLQESPCPPIQWPKSGAAHEGAPNVEGVAASEHVAPACTS